MPIRSLQRKALRDAAPVPPQKGAGPTSQPASPAPERPAESDSPLRQRQTLRFWLNGRTVEVSDVPPTLTLLEWLRSQPTLTGTKEGCAEGDCGACTVAIASLDAGPDALDPSAPPVLHWQSQNACLIFLPAVDGKAVMTVEGLQRADGSLHPAQEAMVQCHGSQCGFCTPGFVMSLWSLYQQGAADPGAQERRDALTGNLCRCTGYRPILEAAQYMYQLPAVPSDRPDPAAIRAALQPLQDAGSWSFGGVGQGRWDAPNTLPDLLQLLNGHPDAVVVAGATDVALWSAKALRPLPHLIHLGRIGALRTATRQADGSLLLGAGLNLQEAGLLLAGQVPTVRDVLVERFASRPIRHSATIGGNIANGSPIGDSMPVLIALGATVHLASVRGTRTLPLEAMYLDYRRQDRKPDEVVVAVEVPAPEPGQQIQAWKISRRVDSDISAVCFAMAATFEPPPASGAEAVTADPRGTAAPLRLRQVRIGLGGTGPVPQRAPACEAALLAGPWSLQTLHQAIDALEADVRPISDMRASASYRRRMVENLLLRFAAELPEPWRLDVPARHAEWAGAEPATHAATAAAAPSVARAAAAAAAVNRAPSGQAVQAPAKGATRARQGSAGGVSGMLRPGAQAGQGTRAVPLPPHESARLHVTGGARYTDDLPEPAGLLHAALGLSQVAHGRIVSMDLEAVRTSPGVVAVFTAADIPGENNCGPILKDDPVLADGTVSYWGQALFLVVAHSRRQARIAARRGKVQIEPLPVQQDPQAAVAAGDWVVPPMRLVVGDPQAAAVDAPVRCQGQLSIGGQEQFYLEGQIAMAIPGEQGDLQVWCSTQHPTEMQAVVAHALHLNLHQVQVSVRRMGGGFGGKESQSALFAVCASLAASALGVPVKLRPDRDDDMVITGKRHPFEAHWELTADAQGGIRSWSVRMVADAGYSADLSGPVAARALCHADGAYRLPATAIEVFAGRTHRASNTAFRGFGGPQGALPIEVALDDLARRLQRDPLDIRLANVYRDATDTTPYGQAIGEALLPNLLAEMAERSDYRARRAAIRATQQGPATPSMGQARRCRGIALTPVKFGISFNVTHFNQAGALVQVYLDGSVRVSHGGTEMGQGLHTKVALVVAQVLGIDPSRVRSSATQTEQVPNTSATAASTGFDLNGQAAAAAARTIRTRLETHLTLGHGAQAGTLRFDRDRVTFRAGGQEHQLSFGELVQSAYRARVQLWSDGFYATPGLHWDPVGLRGKPFHYFACGAAVAEVEVDLGTGEWQLLRADLLQDAGRSIHPDIDRGQIEGGFIQGMGWLTREELVWSADGRLLTHAPSTYKIPSVNDCPDQLHTHLYHAPTEADTIHKARATGEPPLLLAFAVFLALRDAISSVGGHRIDPPLRAPASTEAILDAIEAVRSQARSQVH